MKGVGKSWLIVYLFELMLQVRFTLYLLLHLFTVLARQKGIDDESQHSPVPPAGEGAKYDFNEFDWVQGGRHPFVLMLEIGGPDRGKEKATVQNVFINYCKKHIGCEKHVANWRRRRNLLLNIGEKKTPELQVNHRAKTDAVCVIVEKVNGKELSQKKPFIVEGDVKHELCYSWIFKVRCVFCGSKFKLVSSKRNLEHNLREHVSSKKHQENVEFQLCSTSHDPVRSGAKGRPKKFDPRDLKRQRCIDSFFIGAQSSGSVSNPSSIEDCKKVPSEVHSDLSLLCWRFWFMSVVFGVNVYDVKPFLDDQKRSCTWLDYLTIPELRSQAQCRAKARRKEQIKLFRERSGDSGRGRDSGEAYSEVYNPKFALNIWSFIENLLQGRIPVDSELGRVLCLCIWSAKWEARCDTLIGFCGDKDNHVCKMDLEVEVGSGESGYSKIVESFEQKIQGSYAQVVIVNPLHEKLPRLIVYASVTCNLFTGSWVRDHWKGLKHRWDKCCRQAVVPVLGHASDGDAHRRKFMLEDYLGSEGQRWTIGWDGRVLSGILLDSRDVYALGDQDPIHNRKKMINPLDKSSYPIVLGDFHACLEHVQLVYKLYSHDHHGLNIDDVMRRDRQNWAGPQRICSRKV
ncbi:hypothetical protein R1flu_002090 [Riccia fluitans]|uniref:C2H2-type domain-containing protein n=1 Tax=Riccia fluitans TaxID=41844 RepID=A0ABD1Y549_9MARC